MAHGNPLAERLSLFWGSIQSLRGGLPEGRFPPLDRLDLILHGRLLSGRDTRDGLPKPSVDELVVGAVRFALEVLGRPRGDPASPRSRPAHPAWTAYREQARALPGTVPLHGADGADRPGRRRGRSLRPCGWPRSSAGWRSRVLAIAATGRSDTDARAPVGSPAGAVPGVPGRPCGANDSQGKHRSRRGPGCLATWPRRGGCRRHVRRGIEMTLSPPREQMGRIFGSALGMPFAVRYWDGREDQFGDGAPTVRLVFRSPNGLARMLKGGLGFGEAYMDGEIEIDGDARRMCAILNELKPQLGFADLLRLFWFNLRLGGRISLASAPKMCGTTTTSGMRSSSCGWIGTSPTPARTSPNPRSRSIRPRPRRSTTSAANSSCSRASACSTSGAAGDRCSCTP